MDTLPATLTVSHVQQSCSPAELIFFNGKKDTEQNHRESSNTVEWICETEPGKQQKLSLFLFQAYRLI